jgi:putative two-component system response regulator
VDEGNGPAAKEAGADALLKKPFSPLELLGVVERLAGGRLVGPVLLERMQQYTRLLAEEAGKTPQFSKQIDETFIELLESCAPLHDIGKIAIPDSILLKPGKLSDEEYEVVKTHALLGARVLTGADSEQLEVAERIVRHHHERWDGAGYPDALEGEDIPVVARITAVADVFDVLVHERPYKDSWSVEAAAEEIRKGAGTQFDPAVVEVFEELGPTGWRSEAQPI